MYKNTKRVMYILFIMSYNHIMNKTINLQDHKALQGILHYVHTDTVDEEVALLAYVRESCFAELHSINMDPIEKKTLQGLIKKYPNYFLHPWKPYV